MTLTPPTYDPVLERSPEDDEAEPASLELRIITRALLQVGRVLPALEPPQRELPPLGGFSTVPIRINPR